MNADAQKNDRRIAFLRSTSSFSSSPSRLASSGAGRRPIQQRDEFFRESRELINEVIRQMGGEGDPGSRGPRKQAIWQLGDAMARHPSSRPTDVELEILTVLWQHGPCTVRQVHDLLSAQRDTGYSTTLKMMQIMRDKGLVTRDESVRPQVYQAAEAREHVELEMLDDLSSRVFGGSAARLVMRMLSARRVSPDELAQMQKLIQEAEEGER